MRKYFKRMVASAMATLTLVTAMAGMSVNAAETRNVTATKNFSVGSYTAKATLYRVSTQASASTSLTDASSVTVTLNITGTVTRTTTTGSQYSDYISVAKYGTNFTLATSGHLATKGSYTGSADMRY